MVFILYCPHYCRIYCAFTVSEINIVYVQSIIGIFTHWLLQFVSSKYVVTNSTSGYIQDHYNNILHSLLLRCSANESYIGNPKFLSGVSHDIRWRCYRRLKINRIQLTIRLMYSNCLITTLAFIVIIFISVGTYYVLLAHWRIIFIIKPMRMLEKWFPTF